ncbi:putative thiol methyltransferase [Aspergillus lucknowensis]|uniref:S-adenosyl-L-methionine-dependent methyltransferase n=1 Tax=Aspergillus lucknowensis TaxID=176173 RepID=A0ABR4LQB4_9EURO
MSFLDAITWSSYMSVRSLLEEYRRILDNAVKERKADSLRSPDFNPTPNFSAATSHRTHPSTFRNHAHRVQSRRRPKDTGQAHPSWKPPYRVGGIVVTGRQNHPPMGQAQAKPDVGGSSTTKRAVIGGPLVENEGVVTRRKKALVPGCGRGVDVLMLASFGYDAYGLEYSTSAIEESRKEEQDAEQKYPVRDAEIGKGTVTWVHGDFFEDTWLEGLGLDKNCFDLIYDYTFFCAFPPLLRPAWSLRYTQLLAPSPFGNLVCLEFPRHKDPLQHGPPYSSPSEAYMEHLSHPGEELSYDATGYIKRNPLREPSPLGLERVAYWQPAQTHDFGTSQEGEVFDRVSIWRRR